MISTILESVRKQESMAAKANILTRATTVVPHIMEIFHAAYDPELKYGIRDVTAIGSSMPIHRLDEVDGWEVVSMMLNRLAIRDLVGNDAKREIVRVTNMFSPEDANIIAGIINKELHCGYTAGYAKREYSVALAKEYDQKKHKLDGTWLCSRKLDGVRCQVHITDKTVRFISRTGKEFNIFSDDFKQKFLQYFTAGTVLDGEMCILNNGAEDFQAMVSLVHKKGILIDNAKFHIFDCLTKEEFESGTSETTLLCRLSRLCCGYSDELPFCVLQQFTYTPESFELAKKYAAEQGWEGLMLRKNTFYVGKRSTDLLKVKAFKDAEYIVKAVKLGEMDVGRETKKNMLLSVDIVHKGNIVSVGSGFSIKQREEFGADQALILGKCITVKYFEETTNKNGGTSLRFPTFKGVHGKERTT